jgi:hypothetical protein
MFANQKTTADQVRQSLFNCPNCWGHQEYGGEDREAYAETMDANANAGIGRRKAFVQQFVETNVTGVRSKK